MNLAFDVGRGGLVLGIQRVKILIETLVGRDPRIDRAEDLAFGYHFSVVVDDHVKRSATRAGSSVRLGPGNESRHACLHHRVEPDIRSDALPNLPHGIFGKG